MPTDTPARRIWDAALGRLQLALPKPTFDTWLRETAGLSLGEQRLVVEVPNTFTAAWLEQRVHGLVEDAVSAVARDPVEVRYHVRGAGGAEGPAPQPVPGATESPTPDTSFARPRLNADCTFDSFVVGEANQLAFAASIAVSDAPGQSYNPLFLYGAVGLGKTHLLHAIGHRAALASRRIIYVTTEQFTNDYLTSIRERRADAFRDRYRSADVLLIDDIQFLSGKEGTQEGFFHTFNALRDSGSQIVITCDRPPAALPLLEERLRSRLEWGLMADIGPPDLETRMAILLKHAERSSVPVPNEVVEFIAQRVTSNIRHLEGCINRVTALAYFGKQPVSIQLATNAIGALATQQAGPSTPKAIISAVGSYYNLPSSALVSGRRDKPAAQARQVAMYLLRQVFTLTPEEIGQALGNRDRTTVLYALKQIGKKAAQDASFGATLEQLKASVSRPLENPEPR